MTYFSFISSSDPAFTGGCTCTHEGYHGAAISPRSPTLNNHFSLMAALGGGVALEVGAQQQPLLALVPVEVLLLPLRSCHGVRGVDGGHGSPLADRDVAAVPSPPVTPTMN